MHTIVGAGHWVQQERGPEVSRLLVEWLEDTEPPVRPGEPPPTARA
jgi:hypothetical protein